METSKDIQALLRRAVEMIRAKRLEEARAVLNDALILVPNNVDALYLLARIEEQPAQRVALLQRIVQVNPGYRDAAARLDSALQEAQAMNEVTSIPMQKSTEVIPPARRRLIPVIIATTVVLMAAVAVLLWVNGHALVTPEGIVNQFFQAVQKGDVESVTQLLGDEAKVSVAFCGGPIGCITKDWPEIAQVTDYSTTVQTQSDVTATVLFRTHALYNGSLDDVCELYTLGKTGNSWKVEDMQRQSSCNGMSQAAVSSGNSATIVASPGIATPSVMVISNSTQLALVETSTQLASTLVALQEGPTLTATFLAPALTQTSVAAEQTQLNMAIADTATAAVALTQLMATAIPETQTAIVAGQTQVAALTEFAAAQVLGETNTAVAQQNTVTALTQVAAAATQTRTAFGAALTGHLVFEKDRVLYLIATDGSGMKALTTFNGAPVESPALSPDGRQVVFESNKNLYLVSVDGSAVPQKLTSPPYANNSTTPIWSPNGQQIAFVCNCAFGEHRIYIMQADGSAAHPIGSIKLKVSQPAWSPDGHWLAYVAQGSVQPQLFIMSLDGQTTRQLTMDAASTSTAPVWSADGKQLVFSNSKDGQQWRPFIINADGTGLRPVTDLQDNCVWPNWSPDGSYLAFLCDRGGQWQIYAMTLNNANPVRMFDTEADSGSSFAWGK